MQGYSVHEVAQLLGLSVRQVRAYVRSGFIRPERGERGALRFSFQDLVLLRTAQGLVAARIAPQRVRRALQKLKDQLPNDRPLSALAIAAEGNRIVVSDGAERWNPESGQRLFDFQVAELVAKVAPLVARSEKDTRRKSAELKALSADDWYALGCDLELYAPSEARDAYRRAVELDPHLAEAHVNLGRLLHEAAETAAAEAHYRLALSARPDDATAAFNLGVVLEDLGRIQEALSAYEQALASDGSYADAHYNLACLFERMGESAAALRHLNAYRKLTRNP